MGMEDGFRADGGSCPQNHVGPDPGAFADPDPLSQDRVRAYAHPFPEDHPRPEDSRRMDRGLLLGRRIECS